MGSTEQGVRIRDNSPTGRKPGEQSDGVVISTKQKIIVDKDGQKYVVTTERVRLRKKRRRSVTNPNYKPPKKRKIKVEIPPWPKTQYERKGSVITNQPETLCNATRGSHVIICKNQLLALKKKYGHTDRHSAGHITQFATKCFIDCQRVLSSEVKNGKIQLATDERTAAVIRAEREQTPEAKSRIAEMARLKNHLKDLRVQGRAIDVSLQRQKKLNSDIEKGSFTSSAECRSPPLSRQSSRGSEPAPVPDEHAPHAKAVNAAQEQYREAVDMTIASLNKNMGRLMGVRRAVKRSRKLQKELSAHSRLLRERKNRAETRNCDEVIRSLISKGHAWNKFVERVGRDPFQVSA